MPRGPSFPTESRLLRVSQAHQDGLIPPAASPDLHFVPWFHGDNCGPNGEPTQSPLEQNITAMVAITTAEKKRRFALQGTSIVHTQQRGRDVNAGLFPRPPFLTASLPRARGFPGLAGDNGSSHRRAVGERSRRYLLPPAPPSGGGPARSPQRLGKEAARRRSRAAGAPGWMQPDTCRQTGTSPLPRR